MERPAQVGQGQAKRVPPIIGDGLSSRRTSSQHQPLRVLLVEDNPADADLCQLYLREAFGLNIEILHVTRLAQAERMVSQRAIDVILLDLGLPDSTGVGSVTRLHACAADTPIIVLTGNRDEQLGVHVIREQAQDFCSKQDLSTGVLLHSIRHAMERHRLQAQYSRVLETSPDGIVVIDDWERLLYVNQSASVMLGLTVPDDIGNRLPADLSCEDAGELEFASGQVVEVRTVTLDWDEVPATMIAFHDITDRKQAEWKLQHLVQYDQLTGLSSRAHFFDYLERLIALVDREGGMIGLLFMDLDRFKYVNDTLGHHAGDELLSRVGERLRRNTRACDFIARLGGDEFALVLPELEQPDDAAHMAEKLIETFREPLTVQGVRIGIGVSIGISTYPHCASDALGLYAGADTAMYQAKAQGQNHYRYFSEDLQSQVQEHLNREQAVRSVVAMERLWVAYQPQVRAVDGVPVGVEALLRWPADSATVLSPDQFIPVMEDIGLIGQVGAWVMQQSAEMAVSVERQTGIPLRVAVNVSMRQLYDGSLHERVADVLKKTGLPAERLELELTESVIMADLERTFRTLETLREMGVSIAIDDFGTGYSSLSYLRRLPVDVLKIDRSFVVEIGQNPQSEAILHSLVSLARALDLKVVAEGVETEAERRFLRNAGCDCLQGYYICKPEAASVIGDWLQAAPAERGST